jgi:polysaccharide pyruvyl transferase WcaK-like protein
MMKTPILGLTYAPKVQSLFKLLEKPELALDLGSLEPESLLSSMITFWEEREKEKKRISPLIDGLKEKAHGGFDRLADLFP